MSDVTRLALLIIGGACLLALALAVWLIGGRPWRPACWPCG